MYPLNIFTHPWLYEGPRIQIRTIVNSALFLRHPGCLPFTQRFQYFRMENKWNTHFWSTQPENYRNKRFA